jgi:hypothetical protein
VFDGGNVITHWDSEIESNFPQARNSREKSPMEKELQWLRDEVDWLNYVARRQDRRHHLLLKTIATQSVLLVALAIVAVFLR